MSIRPLPKRAELVSYNNQLLESLRNSPVASTDQVQKAISDIEAQNASLSSTITLLEQLANQLDNNAQAVKNATDTVANVAKTSADNLQKSAKDFQITILPEIDTSLDSLASAIGTLRGATESLRTLFDQESTLLTQLASMLEQSKSICAEVGLSLEALESNLESTYTDLRSLQNSASFKELTTLLGMNPDDVSSFMSSPVKLDTVTLYPVNPYGSGIAPFFSNLALWVCGFILMAIVRLRVDPAGLPRFSATQAYFGRWLFSREHRHHSEPYHLHRRSGAGYPMRKPCRVHRSRCAGRFRVRELALRTRLQHAPHRKSACGGFARLGAFLDRQVCSPSR